MPASTMPASTMPASTMPMCICPITGTAPKDTLIVFDKDGVLLDLNATWMTMGIAMGAYLEEKCGGAISKEDLLAHVGVDLMPDHPSGGIIRENSPFAAGSFADMQDIWAESEPKLAPVFADFDNYRADINAIVVKTAHGGTVPKGAVKDGMIVLKEAGFKLGVATNDNTESAVINLEDLTIKDMFDVIICADSGYGSKPKGGGLLQACAATGIPPKNAIMVGDTETDFRAAEKAGYKGFITIADNAPHKPEFIPHTDAVITSIEHLPEVVLTYLDI